jgi:hypothetical protein
MRSAPLHVAVCREPSRPKTATALAGLIQKAFDGVKIAGTASSEPPAGGGLRRGQRVG